jgi:ligand-binding sensor domain-containing protein
VGLPRFSSLGLHFGDNLAGRALIFSADDVLCLCQRVKRNMKLQRRTLAVLAIAVGSLCLLAVGFAFWRAQRALGRSERDLSSFDELPVTVGALAPQPNPGFEGMPAPAVFKSAAEFDGKFYLAGPPGLFVYSLSGALDHLYRVGLELPAAPLGQMAVGTIADAREPELLIATRGEGVLAFDGQNFRQIRPADPESRQVTAILPLASGRLLLGTAKQGLLVYDGKSLRRFHPTTDNMYVTALAGTEAELWIGTLDRGLLHWQGGQTAAITEAEGLPDQRVEAISADGYSVYVGTPLGVAEIRSGKVARVLAAGHYAHAVLASPTALLVGEFEGGILRVGLDAPAENPAAHRPIGLHGDEAAPRDQSGDAGSPVEQFLAVGDTRYAVTGSGFLEQQPGGEWSRVFGGAVPASNDALLADRNISALMVASDGRLWVGYFDRGLDILPATGGAPVHFENDHVFCVNRIVENPRQSAVAVATANGLVLFDRDGRQKQVLDRETGLIASHVTDVALYGDGLVAATPAGITFLDASGAHSLYAFQGLVNNHVYALGANGNRLWVGTLGGLSLVSDGEVQRNLTTGNSGLKHNWITGLAEVGSDWLVGTYGAGVLRISAAGDVTATDATRSGTVVNPGAMLADGRLVLAGTLGQGLLVGDSAGTRWKTVTAGLPSLNVTALTIDKGTVYVGTDNGLVKIAEDRL